LGASEERQKGNEYRKGAVAHGNLCASALLKAAISKSLKRTLCANKKIFQALKLQMQEGG
jgi:hypothetical protein